MSEKHEASRRRFIQRAGAGSAAAAAAALGFSAEPAEAADLKFDGEYDMVVCGSGCGGLASALFSRWQGNSTVILEKAGSIGGTTSKAAFWYWVPNNAAMRKAGIADPKPDFLKYVARLTNPGGYDANHPRYGLTPWEYEMCEAIYDSASPAVELLAEKGALRYRHVADVPDYFAELPEDKAPKGRVLVPAEAAPSMSDGGRVAVRTMSAKARQEGIAIRTGTRVTKKLQNNELAHSFFEWDGAQAEYPNLVRIAIWDQRSQDHSASAEYGRLIVPKGTDDRHVIKGATLAELARAIDERMAKYAGVTGSARPAP